MASGSTTNYALPYPLDTDPVNVAGDVEDLAVTIDSILRESIDDASAALITGATVSNGFSTPVYTDNGSSTGSLAFSLAQDIRTTASPQFVNLTLTGDAAVNGGDITTTETTFNLVNATATTLNIGQAATTISMGAASGTTTINNDLNVASGKVFKINSTEVLSATTLGSGVTGSSLTSVGTINTGTWQGTAIAANMGGTGLTSAPSANGQVLIGSSAGAYSLSTITQGTGMSITNGSGSITLAVSSVPNSEIIKFDTGTTEGTDLYTFDGSSAKTIDIQAGTNVTLTKAAGIVTINATTSGGTTANPLVFKFDSGTTEGTDLYTFDGSSAKTVDFIAGPNIILTKAAGSITIDSTGGGTVGMDAIMFLGGM